MAAVHVAANGFLKQNVELGASAIQPDGLYWTTSSMYPWAPMPATPGIRTFKHPYPGQRR